MAPINRFGDMQNILCYAKWLLEINAKDAPYAALEDFFVCQQVQRNIDKEIHSQGSYSLISDDRKPKQDAFKDLANQLSCAAPNKDAYR